MTSDGAPHRGMHYSAQHLNERLAFAMLTTSAIVAFACGWVANDYDVLKRVYFVGVCGTLALVVPHWEWMYGSKQAMRWRAAKGGARGRERTPEPSTTNGQKKTPNRAARRKARSKTRI